MTNENNQNQQPEQFSDDQLENLRIENEILKLKVEAGSGAFFGGEGNLPPEVENQFLQQVQQLEESWQNVKYIKVYDLLGRPAYKKAAELHDAEIGAELERFRQVMAEKEVYLDVLGQYPPSVIYRFITEELFEHETDDMQLPGWSQNFIYEEFHPNYQMDIERTTNDFIQTWFRKQFNEYYIDFAIEIGTPEGWSLTGSR
jgi:hypothetical protein